MRIIPFVCEDPYVQVGICFLVSPIGSIPRNGVFYLDCNSKLKCLGFQGLEAVVWLLVWLDTPRV
jgi:hypothetical protein